MLRVMADSSCIGLQGFSPVLTQWDTQHCFSFWAPKSNLLLENDIPKCPFYKTSSSRYSASLPITTGLSNSTCTSISARPSGETRPRIGEIPTPSGTLSTWYTATFFPPLTMGIERSAGSPTAKTPRSSLFREVLVQPATVIIPCINFLLL